jgi:hypothetical protein
MYVIESTSLLPDHHFSGPGNRKHCILFFNIQFFTASEVIIEVITAGSMEIFTFEMTSSFSTATTCHTILLRAVILSPTPFQNVSSSTVSSHL